MSEGFFSRGFRGRRQKSDLSGRIPPGQYLERGFPVLSAGPTPHTQLSSWDFSIVGKVDQPKRWSWDEFRALPRETVTKDIHCVTKWSKLDTHWEGVSLDMLLAQVKYDASYVIAFSDGGYTTNLPLEEVLGGKAWVVDTYEGAYIEETQCSLVDYLDLYRTHHQALLAQRGMLSTDYPHSVATTWLLSFQKVEQANPAAAELLQLCAFLAPDRIPEELLRNGAIYWPASLQQAAADHFMFNQMIAELLKFSLVKRLADDHLLSIHRLVQTVQMDMMDSEVQHQWAQRVIRGVNKVFPEKPNDVTAWSECLRYLDQVQACNTLIEQHELLLTEGADLLDRTGLYLNKHALYTIAEPLYQRASMIREQQDAITKNSWAEIYRKQGKYEQAKPLFLRA